MTTIVYKEGIIAYDSRAVQQAMKRDVNTGGRVRTIIIKEKKK